MNTSLKISVIVPCYNQAHFLDECMNSIHIQTYPNWECILVDDGSTDNTREKAIEWQKKDSRVQYIEKVNGGLSSARNYGIKNATGDYIQFLDCDDFIDSDKFLKSVQQIREPEHPIVITNFVLFNQKKQKPFPAYCKLEDNCFTYDSILKEWDKRFTIPIHCALFPYALVIKTQFDEELKAKEDWVFWLQIYTNTVKTIFIDEPLVYYRMSSFGMTNNDDFMHENQKTAYQKIEKLIDNPELYLSYLKFNNDFYIEEIFKLKKEIKYVKEKRKLKYKLNKLLRLLRLK